MTEKQLKKLKKAELLHILLDAIGLETIGPMWRENRHFQKVANIKCYDCNIIERKLQS